MGVGERRLKNAELVLEWVPQAGQVLFQYLVSTRFRVLVEQGLAPNVAASQAMLEAREQMHNIPNGSVKVELDGLYVAAVSLAEGETIRRLIHLRHACLGSAGVRLRRLDGSILDQSEVCACACIYITL